MRINTGVALSILLLFLIISCKKDESITIPYAGTWETETICIPFDEQGSVVNRKMVCDFSADSFSNIINLVIGYIEEPVCGISGLIEKEEGKMLHFTCTKLGLYTGLNIDSFNADSLVFDSLYSTYAEVFMPSDFETSYSINGDDLDLLISATTDTVHLTRSN